ncbi:ankyrin repeat domain-containing protein [Novipirellula artificiosorum]|uniref:ankyrin repeat domain-containing protein n=1 Tax=Novipirellula artificiosorum TaxID=2528016 RepID=UPI0011B50C6B
MACAAEQEHIETIAKLIELGADVNFKADYTALQRACSGDQADAVALLLKYGADVNTARHNGHQAISS